MTDLTRLKHKLDTAAATCLAVIETPRGERNKFTYNPENQTFELSRLLPAGMSFPLDFGFVPTTIAEDSDPLDIMVAHDTPLPRGVVLPVRLAGLIRAEQTEDGKTVRNDRLIGVALASSQFAGVLSLPDLGEDFLKTLTDFWDAYERLRGKDFRILGAGDAAEAVKRVQQLAIS